MYKDFYQLERYPFHNTPDPAFFFSSKSHREALASMVYGIEEGKGFILITGDVGSGKTMLVQALKSELGEQHVVIEIANPWVSPEDVLGAIRTRIGARRSEREEPALLDSVKKRLIKLDEEGKRVILVIDEAHQIPERTLEGIRLISNIETSTRKLLQIVLLGQDELATMLGRYSMRQVQQRIALSYHLARLNIQETEEYIRHRLDVAGCKAQLFPKECIELIYRESLGSPRVINQLCDNCLLFAYGRRSPVVTLEITREAIANIHPERALGDRPAAAEGGVQMPTPLPLAEPPAPLPFALPDRPPPAAQVLGPVPQAEQVDSVLPFKLPSPQRQEPPRAEKAGSAAPSAKGLGLRHLTLALALGLGLGAIGVWYALEKLGMAGSTAGIALPGVGADPASGTPNPPTPGSSPRQGQDATRGMLPPGREGAGESPVPARPAAPQPAPAAALPLPGSANGSNMREVVVSAQASISMLASEQYGAWNETVRDIVHGANPGLGDLDSLPAGTRVRLPTITRDSLVVQDGQGRYLVYFGSFEKIENARINLEALRRSWSSATLVTQERHGSPIYRIYIASLPSRDEAISVARSLWLKYLPVLN